MNRKPLAACLLLLCGSSLLVSQSPANHWREQTRPLSAYVFGTFLSWEPGKIELLVLWRGSTPRWFLGPGGARGAETTDAYHLAMQFGTVQLDFSFDRTRRLARIRDIEVSLSGGKNVLMVDNVDQKNGTTTAKTISVDLTFTEIARRGSGPAGLGTLDVVSILTRSPEIVSFLQCNAAATDAKLPRRAPGYVCDDLNPK